MHGIPSKINQTYLKDKEHVLDRDPDWFMGGVSEAIYITAHKPTLNRGGWVGGNNFSAI